MQAVFIDRDGTMGGAAALEFPTDYVPYEGTAESFRQLNAAGYTPMIFTNQSCIARGKDRGYDFAAEFRGIGAVDWFICPHDTGDGCNCRKPQPGLLKQAQQKYGLDLSACYVIGDRWSDMAAGGQMGCRLILVLTGRGQDALGCDREKWGDYQPVCVAENLKAAADWLCRGGERHER